MTGANERREASAIVDDRYRSYEGDDGSFVLYDGENDHAWVQSDVTVELLR